MLLVAGAAVPAVTIMEGIVVVAPVPAVLAAGCVAPLFVALAPALAAAVVPARPAMPLVAAVVPAAEAVVAPVAVMPGCIVPAPSVAGAGALEHAANTLVMHKAYSRLDMA